MEMVTRLCVIFLSFIAVKAFLDAANKYDSELKKAFELVNTGNYAESVPYLLNAVSLNRNDVDASQLLGSIYVKFEQYEKGIPYLDAALQRSGWSDPSIIANYVESLRLSGNLEAAREVGRKYSGKFPQAALLLYNYAVVEEGLHNRALAIDLYLKVIAVLPTYIAAWKNCAELLLFEKQHDVAEKLLLKAAEQFPGDYYIFYLIGSNYQLNNQLELAVVYFLESLRLKPDHYVTKSNLGAAYQTLGKAELALAMYESAMPFKSNDSGIRNNYGALLGVMNRKDEEVRWLKESLEIEPNMTHALVNLGGFYQDEGLLVEADHYLRRAWLFDAKKTMLALRIALMMYPVCSSWQEMVRQRNDMESKLITFLEAAKVNPPTQDELDASLDRIHFYIQYAGLNDRYMQELIVQAYHYALKDFVFIAPNLLQSLTSLQHQVFPPSLRRQRQQSLSTTNSRDLVADRLALPVPSRKVRIGFISKFFGIFEPHGLLLDGVMKYLPRSQYIVYACPVARTDGKPTSPSIVEAADHVIEISLIHAHAQMALSQLQLDILVFADVMSEPMNHFLAHSRLATVQVAFWGNPITSASLQMDYFASSDFMEHPYRTRMPISDEPYSEQVVLIEGQGIWYEKPETPTVTMKRANFTAKLEPDRNYSRADFNLSDDWFVFFCPQSVFKMHPLFDFIFAEILSRHPRAHIVLTGGRRDRWTEIYSERLSKSLNYDAELCQRLHVIPRVSSEKFLALLKIADVILHPFPFDGSRTSADAFIAGVPLLTMPTEYLRGRMGASFLRTMNLPELVAKNADNYVDIAIRLLEEPQFYASVKQKLLDRVDLIWEDLDTTYSWTKFFNTVSGLPPLTWEQYLRNTGRDTVVENQRRTQRAANQQAFDAVWGPEKWLLEDGKARLESRLTENEIPKIFNNWKSVVHADSESSPGIALYGRSSTSSTTSTTTITRKTTSTSTSTTTSSPKERNLFSDLQQRTEVSSDPPSQKNSQIKIRLGPTDTAGNNVNANHPILELEEMRNLVLKGELQLAMDMGNSLIKLPQYTKDPLFLLEYGAVQYFRGEYQGALETCRQVVSMEKDALVGWTCIGVAAMYLNIQQESLDAFVEAWRLAETKTQDPLPSKLFGYNKQVLEFNLFSALNNFGRYKDCVDVASTILDIPEVGTSGGGEYFIMLALIDWNHSSRAGAVDDLVRSLQQQGVLLDGVTGEGAFLQQVFRLQSFYQHVMTPVMDCTLEYLSTPLQQRLIKSVMSLVSTQDTLAVELGKQRMMSLHPQIREDANGQRFMSVDGIDSFASTGITLITQHFLADNQFTQTDMSDALQQNLDNSAISSVYLLNEEELDYSSFRNAWKIKQHVLGRRMTFQDAFMFSNLYLPNRTVALVNADIYFDDSLHRFGDATRGSLTGKVLALLKWTNPTRTQDLRLHLRIDSQDAWIFQTPMNENVIKESGFYMGLPRCDNRLAEILVSSGGYEVTNPAFALHAIELHSVERDGRLYHAKNSVSGTGRSVLLSDQTQF